MLTRVDGEGLFVKITFNMTKEDVRMENRTIENVANQENGADAVNISTL